MEVQLDGIEGFIDKMAANGVVRNEELKQKDCDPFLKLDGKNTLGSPVLCTLSRSNWPESSLNNCSVTMEGKDLSGCVTSLSGSEPPCKSVCSINDTGLVVEELTLKNDRKPNLALLSSSQGCRKNPDQVASGFISKDSHGGSLLQENDQILLNVRGELSEMPSGIRSLKPLSSNHFEQDPEKISAYLRVRDNKIISSNMLSIAKRQLKTQSTNIYSQILVKETLKGKGISKIPSCSGFGSPVLDQNGKKQGYVSEVACDARLKSIVNNDPLCSHVLDRSGPESTSNGICLREWLKPGRRKVDIVESLLIFRQIVKLLDFAHSQGIALQDLRPSRFILLPSNRVKYTGSTVMRESNSIMNQNLIKKRPFGQDASAERILGGKKLKQSEEVISIKQQPQFTTSRGCATEVGNEDEFCIAGPQNSGYGELQYQNNSSYQTTMIAVQQQSTPVNFQLEEKWYTSPEELSERGCTLSSNIYGLGVLLFELLCCSESWEVHSAVMLDLSNRILPPSFLSQNPKEAGFCFLLLHPEPLARPTTRELLQSELIGRYQELYGCDNFSNFDDDHDAGPELLLSFLNSLKDRKQERAFKLVEDIRCLEEDINKFRKRHLSGAYSDSSLAHNKFSSEKEQGFCLEDPIRSGVSSRLFTMSNMNETWLMKNISQLEDAYFSTRSHLWQMEIAPVACSDKDVLNNRDKWRQVRNDTQDSGINQKSGDCLGAFVDGISKFARHRKFELCGTLRNGDLLNSTNVICSLSLDRDEDYIATAGVSKKIKIFDLGSLVDSSLDIHYPVVEILNKSKLSSVCWNNYFKNYLASTDYDGVVQMWDAVTGQGFSQYVEHQKRAWSVDFSQADPTKFASGSDDFSVKLWNVNEKSSIGTIWNPANVCCVQFSPYSSHLLVFGSADYKIYGYDLRHTRIPWCTFAGHGKTVSYVKFVDAETLVSASTDNTLKLWDLNKSSSTGLSSKACSLTFSGHTNEKNFVGLSVSDGYITCGSETNEVYSYYRCLPMPITSHKFGSIDPVSGSEVGDSSGQFVSSVCWRRKSNIVVAANSSGTLNLLRMV